MVINYKWVLRKGGGKMRCPNCGQMRFVPYVSAKDGKTVAGAKFGRCDREQSCGYQKYPNGKDDKDVQPVKVEPKKPLRFYPAAVEMDTETPLYEYVRGLCGDASAMIAWIMYKVGRDGTRTVFWQIAKDGTVRAGKSIPYGKDGHRIKTDRYPANWLHKSRDWKGMFEGEELQQCWFGEHLLNRRPDAPVAIVESEKTAVVMSIFSTKYVWLASGGSQGLKNTEKNKVLAGREVLLVPDHGQYWSWATIAKENGWECTDAIEKSAIFAGCDILDLVEAGAFGSDLLKYRRENENRKI